MCSQFLRSAALSLAVLPTLLVTSATDAAAQDALCPSSQALELEINNQLERMGYAFLPTAYPTLLWALEGDRFWSIPLRDPRSGSTAQQIIAEAYRSDRPGYNKSEKTAKRIEKYLGSDQQAEPGEKRPKKVPSGPTQAAIDAAAKSLSCRFVSNEERAVAEAQWKAHRHAQLSQRQPCQLGNDLAKSNLTVAPQYWENKDRGAVGVLNWALQGEKYWSSYIPSGTPSSQALNGALEVLYYGVPDAPAGPIPANKDLHAAVKMAIPIARKYENHSRFDLPDAAVYPSPEMIAWAEDELQCRLETEGFAQARLDTKDALIKEERAILAEHAEEARIEAERQAARAKEMRGRWLRPVSNAEPVGGYKGSTRYGYEGHSSDLCQAALEGLNKKPTLTSFEEAWGRWMAFQPKNRRCMYRPDVYRTEAEKIADAARIKAKEEEERRAAEERARFNERYPNGYQTWDEIFDQHMERETAKRKTRDDFLDCERRYGVGNCVTVD